MKVFVIDPIPIRVSPSGSMPLPDLTLAESEDRTLAVAHGGDDHARHAGVEVEYLAGEAYHLIEQRIICQGR